MTIDEINKITAVVFLLEDHGYTDAANAMREVAATEFGKLAAWLREQK